MPKLLPFPTRRVQSLAERLLIFGASRERLSKPIAWINRPVPPEPVGNMLQRLALLQPHTALLVENLIADLLAQAERLT
jgi:hypothetical protein